MIFKKKYVRSEWMEGLLWAEDCKNRQSSDESIRASLVGSHLIHDSTDNGLEFRRWVFPLTDFNLGACEYLKYYENNLK